MEKVVSTSLLSVDIYESNYGSKGDMREIEESEKYIAE
jgi:hypothetical protein